MREIEFTRNKILPELKTKEKSLIKSLEKLAKRWEKDGQDLWIFSASGSLHVMLKGETKRNPNYNCLPIEGGVNPANIITTIEGITNDGGDW